MERRDSIAIVIPAYKSVFFRQTLDSLACQSDPRFTVYIGDDCSPEDLRSIADEFKDRLDLHYFRFRENVGGRDLVSQWRRCVDLARDEKFICLFSDDDIMEKDCMRQFRLCLENNPDYDVYHWNISIIDASGRHRKETPDFPDFLSSADFFKKLYSGKIDARMPEFIFRASALKDQGFVSFDLAFRTDNATVMAIAARKGICSIPGESRVLWRDSGINISSSTDTALAERMVRANSEFVAWTEKFFSQAGARYPLSGRRHLKLYLMELVKLYPAYTGRDMAEYLGSIGKISGNPLCKMVAGLYLKKLLRRRIRRLAKHSKG